MNALFVYQQPDSPRYALVKGAARNFLRDNRIPAMYSASLHGWHVRAERVSDLIARAEVDGFRVYVKGAGW